MRRLRHTPRHSEESGPSPELHTALSGLGMRGDARETGYCSSNSTDEPGAQDLRPLVAGHWAQLVTSCEQS